MITNVVDKHALTKCNDIPTFTISTKHQCAFLMYFSMSDQITEHGEFLGTSPACIEC